MSEGWQQDVIDTLGGAAEAQSTAPVHSLPKVTVQVCSAASDVAASNK